MQCGRSRQRLLLHAHPVGAATHRHPAHWAAHLHRAILGHDVPVLAVPIQGPVVGWGLRRGVDVSRPGRQEGEGNPQKRVHILSWHL